MKFILLDRKIINYIINYSKRNWNHIRKNEPGHRVSWYPDPSSPVATSGAKAAACLASIQPTYLPWKNTIISFRKVKKYYTVKSPWDLEYSW